MTPEQLAFLSSRRRQIRYWPFVASFLLLMLGLGALWVWQNEPLYLNPVMVLDYHGAQLIDESQLAMLAARGALAVIAAGLFLLVVVLLISLFLRNEERLIQMLDEAQAQARLANDSGVSVEVVSPPPAPAGAIEVPGDDRQA